MNKFDLLVHSTKMLTTSVIHIAFKTESGTALEFIPGQFVTFIFEDPNNGKPLRRSYSISTIPGTSSELEIAVSPVAGGFATEIFFNLSEGQRLTCSGPFGRLILKEDEHAAHYLLVATGTGVSPYRAMLPAIAKRISEDPKVKFTVLLGVQYRKDLLYSEDFIEFAAKHERFEFRAYLSREENLNHDYEYSGYVQNAFESLSLNPETDLVYLCGNPNMIDQSFELLLELGFETSQVRREKYISAK